MLDNIEMNNIKLPVYSYSKLDLFEQCNFKYKLRYVDKNFSDESTLVLELGTIAHKGEELKGRYLIDNKPIDYEYIKDVVINGIEEHTEKDKQYIKGVNELKQKYFLDYYKKCDKTGMTYDEKLEIYFLSLINKNFMEGGWRVLAVEKPFEFVYNNRCILKGFIDRIDINENCDLRVVDYKTSKSSYDGKKLTTPLQMVIYALACREMYNRLPIEFKYDFIFLNEEQLACTKGYLSRGEKKLNKILDNIDMCLQDSEYKPNPTPLCYWCDFASHTPLANKKMKDLCDYHCMWTPSNKNFKKKNEYKSCQKENVESVNSFTSNPFSTNPDNNSSFNPFAAYMK